MISNTPDSDSDLVRSVPPYIPQELTDAIKLLEGILSKDYTLDTWNTESNLRAGLEKLFQCLEKDTKFAYENRKRGLKFPGSYALLPGDNFNPGIWGLVFGRLYKEKSVSLAKLALREILGVLKLFIPETLITTRNTEQLVQNYQATIARNGI